MRYYLLFVLNFFVINIHSQSGLSDSLLGEVIQKIKSDQIMDLRYLVNLQQQKIINYLQTYYTDSILCTNIYNLFEFIWNSSFSSSIYLKIRQDAANLLLDIYRIITVNDNNGFWKKKAKQVDFKNIVREKIMNILNAAPFTNIENELTIKE